jgi:hypothetical protein
MAIFSKKHYEAIANAMQQAEPMPNWDLNKHAQQDVVISELVIMFRQDNPNFKPDKFMAACQRKVEENV